VIPARKGGNPEWKVEYDPGKPPNIYFDTNVWIGMNDEDMTILERLERQRGFRYHYSITNYCELLSHFEDDPSVSCPDPFSKYRRCFLKIMQLCYAEVLPSPEMEFLSLVGLEKYVHPAWIPDLQQTALGVEIAANAENLAELIGESNDQDQVGSVPRYVIKPGHYRKLRDTDGESFTRIMKLLTEVRPPIKGSDRDKLDKLFVWFMNLAQFFFLVRPSNGKVTYDLLERKEKERFAKAFYDGAGKLFHIHCVQIAKTTINDKRNIYANDLYDTMQLLHLRDHSRLFVTEDKFFYRYEMDPQIQRVLPWSAFKTSK
jgi:hypothetical protein